MDKLVKDSTGMKAPERRAAGAEIFVLCWSGGAAARPRDENFLREERGWLGRLVLCQSVRIMIRKSTFF